MADAVSYHNIKKQIRDFLEELIRAHDNGIIVIEITRKGYWVEKEIRRVDDDGSFAKLLREKEVRIYSDRYLMKCLTFEEFRGKTVIIFDDIGNNGIQMFYYFALLRRSGAEKVIPAVYALNAEYPFVDNRTEQELEKSRKNEFRRLFRNNVLTEEEIEQLFQECVRKFNQELCWGVWMSPGDIGRLLVDETIWFQKSVFPMVVDLPIFRGIEGGSQTGIVLKRDQWRALCGKNDKWKNVEIDSELAGQGLHCGFFQMKSNELYKNSGNLFLNFIVRYKYELNESLNQMKIVFVPFVIMNSCTLSDMVWNFFHLFEGTSYVRKVIDVINQEIETLDQNAKEASGIHSLENGYCEGDWKGVRFALKRNHNMCRALYRAIIFDISNFIGKNFQDYIKDKIGLSLTYDWELMKENLEEEFIASVRKMYESREMNEHLAKLMSCRMSEKIKPRFVDKEEMVVKRAYTAESLDLYFTDLISRKKKNHGEDMHKRMITLESMIFEAERRFDFSIDETLREALSSYIVEMTENSRIGNEIYVDDEKGILYRGFRSGEFCEILLRWGCEWFYPYVLAFYQKSSQSYKEKYDRFVALVETEFREKNYVGTLISEASFEFYKKYFRNQADNPTQIYNKQYLLDSNDSVQNQRLEEFVREAYKNVTNWNI